MARYGARPAQAAGPADLLLRLSSLQSPEVAASLERMRKRYGRYAVPAATLRAELDRQLGDKTLTDELYATRDE